MERLVKAKKIKRRRKHGFLARKKTQGGRAVLRRRMLKGRKRITL